VPAFLVGAKKASRAFIGKPLPAKQTETRLIGGYCGCVSWGWEGKVLYELISKKES
jgi:hypothetical protein